MQYNDNSNSRQKDFFLKRAALLILCCAISFFLGLVTASLGPCLGDIATNNASSLEAVGSIFTALFLGALVAQLLAGPLGDRIGQPLVLFGGLFLLAAGIFGLSLSTSLPLTLAAVCLAGLGHGSSDLTSLVLAARRYREKSVSALNLVGLLYGVGAFVGPAIAGIASRLWSTTLPALWIGAAGVTLLLPAAAVLASREGPRGQRPKQAAPAPSTLGRSLRFLFVKPLIWALGLLLLIYVGAENALGGWATEYIARTTGEALTTAALAASLFWLALAVGRLIAAAAAAKLSPRAVLGGGIILSFAGTVALWASTGNLAASFIAIALIGAGYGSIYPTAFAMTAAAAPEAPGTATSFVSALGSLGGMIFPWAQGLVLVRWGARASALFLLILGAVMLALFVGLGKRARKSA